MGTSAWRELLRTIISAPSERNRIAAAAGVRSITLIRWINEDSQPRPENLRQLLRALPAQFQRQFLELLEQEESPILVAPGEGANQQEEIPFTLVDEIMRTRATASDSLRFWAVSRMILQHAVRHLDPEPLGMAIMVVRCMPPARDGKILSLREYVGCGTPPWNSDLEHQTMFLGAESLAGYVVTTGLLPSTICSTMQPIFPRIERSMKLAQQPRLSSLQAVLPGAFFFLALGPITSMSPGFRTSKAIPI